MTLPRHARYSSPERIRELAKRRHPVDHVARKMVVLATNRGNAKIADDILRQCSRSIESLRDKSAYDFRVARAATYYALAVRCKAEGDLVNLKRFVALSSLESIAASILDRDDALDERLEKYLPGFAKDVDLVEKFTIPDEPATGRNLDVVG